MFICCRSADGAEEQSTVLLCMIEELWWLSG
jgi:hypothetical protein